MTELSTEVRNAAPGVSVVEVRGEITSSSEPALMDAFSKAAGADTRAVVLDFAGLEYMNSGGIGLLVTLLVRANRQQQRLLASGLSDHYREIFSLTQLDKAISVVDSEADALDALDAR